MDNKYYTPEISEFHVGFEYEESDKAIVENITKWDKARIDFPREIEEVGRYLSVRVKYLDKEDIESLGWRSETILFTIGGIDECVDGYAIDISGGERYEMRVILDKHVQILHKEYDNEVGAFWNQMGFEIKNKSELKRLMVQLGIEGGK